MIAHEAESAKVLTPRYLTAVAKTIYAGGRTLSLQQAATTIYRPLYGQLESILPWIPRDARLLDVGCGTGTLLLLAARLKELEQGYGFDTQEAPIRIAQAANRSPRVSFVCTSEVPPEVIRRCNAVSMIDVLHHVAADAKVPLLGHFLRHATAGTRLIVRDLDPRPRWRAVANRITDYLSTRSRVDYMPLTEVRELIARSGFDIVHAARSRHYVWSLYVVVADKRSVTDDVEPDRPRSAMRAQATG